MSEQRRDRPESARRGLEDLYKRVADAEPDPATDRMIRARAEAAAAPSARHHRVLAWGGGLAVAACLVVAVGIGLQLDPPGPTLPEPVPPPPGESTSGTSEVDAAGAGFRADEEAAEAEPVGAARAPAESGGAHRLERKAEPDAAGDDRRRAQAQAPAANELREIAPARQRLADSLEPLPPEVWLERIETLVEAGRLETARAMLEAFRAQYPEEAVPEALEQLSRKQSGE